MAAFRMKSEACLTLVLILLNISWIHSADSRAGLMVTSPMSWVVSTTESICLLSRLTSPALHVEITVTNSKNEDELVKKDLDLASGERKCIEVQVSDDWKSDTVTLAVVATNDDDEELFNKNTTVTVYSNNIMTFIQTDKPVYKPADTVRIRILSVLGKDTIPIEEPISHVYIEDPARTRIMQWKDVNTTLGLGSVEMKLSSEPPLGYWTIHVATAREQHHSQTFEVKEYVLPKYSVDILSDESVYLYGAEAKWKVCATYTYGEPVNGQVNTYMCNKPYPWANEPKKCVSHNNTQLVGGCYEFTAQLSHIKTGEYQYMGGRTLEIYAEVAEKGTGIVFNKTSEIQLVDHKYRIEFGDSQHYKPGLDYNGKALLKDITGKPAPNKKIYLVYKIYDTRPNVQPINVTTQTNSDGVFEYNISGWFTHNVNKSSITIEVSLSNRTTEHSDAMPYGRRYGGYGGSPSELGYPTSHTIQAWYSASNTYLQIVRLREQDLGCKVPSVINFWVASPSEIPDDAEFYVQIVSHGNILPMNPTSAIKNIGNSTYRDGIYRNYYSFPLSRATTDAMEGNTNILVFYIRPDGETIADGLITNFVHCFKNKVSASFSDIKARPGHETSFSITADAKSLCSIVVVDKSIKLMGATYLTTAQVQESIKTRYDLSKTQQIYSHFPMSSCVEQNHTESEGYPEPMIGRVGRSVMISPRYHSDYVDSQKPFEDIGLLTLTDLTLATKPCRRWIYRAYAMARPAPLGAQVGMPGMPGPPGARAEFMESRVEATADRVSLVSAPAPTLHRNFFPETWLWDLYPIGDSGEQKVPVTLPHTITEWIGNGYCINQRSGLGVSPSFSVTGFQSFFMSFTLPYSMVRGEEVAVPVSVFNYLTDCLTVTLKVQDSPDIIVVNNSKTAKLDVCGNQAEVHTFFVVPKKLGKVNFTVKASSKIKKSSGSKSVYSADETDIEDIVTRQILIEAEGKPEEVSKSAFVCGSGGGDWTFSLPSDVVPDSERSDISVIGDVMGPALSGLDSLLRVPTGCGEQNMLLFAPNIYVLKYLNKTKRLTQDIEKKALENMRTGYQRELTYRHNDGSYSAFGKSDKEGSIWLTAFVIKSFAQAKPYMFIDDRDMNVSIEWMKQAQQENGCFPQIGRVLHKDMQGGAKGEGTAPLTAYILVALLEAGVDENSDVIQKAVRCLNSHNVVDVYTLSVMAYAYSSLDDSNSQKTSVMAKLEEKEIVDGDMKHWESSPEATHDDYHHSSPANIEATSYVLLSLLNGADLSVVGRTLPMVRWLSSQRNSLGGFTSTQDTVLALQGLAEYAGLVHNDNIDLSVQMSANGVSFDFDVTSENSLLLQKHEGLATHKIVHYNVEGTGCALLQASLKFNRMSLQEEIPPSFELKAEVKNMSETEQKCSERTLNICVKYNGTEGKSNMAIVSIKMVSGWTPVKESVDRLKNQVRLNLKRHEIEKNSVQLYFDEIDGNKNCFDIALKQEQIVSDSKPAIVHAYDYYKPAAAAFARYEIQSTCLQRKMRSATLAAAPTGSERPSKGGKPDKKGKTTKAPKGEKKPKPSKKNKNCPVCEESIDNSALEEFCDSNYVFKLTVGRNSSMTLKEIIRSKSKPSKLPQLNGNLKYKLPNNCRCALVKNGAELLVSTPKRPHQKKAGDVWNLQLKKDVTVLKADGGMDCPVA